MLKRRLFGVLLILIGILLVLGAVREFVQFLVIEQIPVIGTIIQLISPSVTQEQLIHLLVGLVLIFVGAIITKKKKQ